MERHTASGPVTIVEVGPERADVVAEVRRHFLSEHRGRDLDRSGRFAAENRWWVALGLTDGWYRSWVAEAGTEVVGGVSLLVHRSAPLPDDDRTAEAWVIALWVRADRRRQGIATRLLEGCRSAAASSGVRRLLLWATEDGRPLYQREGFTTSDRLFYLGVPG